MGVEDAKAKRPPRLKECLAPPSHSYQVQSKEHPGTPLWANWDFVVVGTANNAALDVLITATAKNQFFRVVEAD